MTRKRRRCPEAVDPQKEGELFRILVWSHDSRPDHDKAASAIGGRDFLLCASCLDCHVDQVGQEWSQDSWPDHDKAPLPREPVGSC